MKPNLFIVGAPKCGTTSMHSYLGAHPEVQFPVKKEPRYFGRDLHMEGRLSDSDYMDQFSAIRGVRYTGEAMVYKLFSATAAREIYEMFPESKIIIILRNPVDFMYSLYFQNRYEGIEKAETFEEALGKEIELPADPSALKGVIDMPHRLYYRRNAQFGAQIQRYFNTFSAERILVLSFGEFVEKTEDVYQRTLSFLQLSPFIPPFSKENAAKRCRASWVRGFMKRPPKSIRVLSSFLLSKASKKWLNMIIKKANTAPLRKPSLRLDTRRRLETELEPDVQQIQKLTGLRL